ncbi:PREDICTED: mucin-5AC [Rhagoletis zephyria]|uniref:mucin-5AC n=1 Tax=Rhagoletis zephyria TaxID=28612 RepID=UPI00081149A8|nr:PREDICTED: mucin-5AC [Rhagoletis zephyria]XP_036322342.1 mucin-5AC [Rhagoletis pomonella]
MFKFELESGDEYQCKEPASEKCTSFGLLLLLSAIVAPVFSSPNHRHFRSHCEDEVWEEVPCEQISTRSTTTTTTTESPPRTTNAPTTQRPSTTPRPYTKPPTPAPEVYITTTAASVSSTTPSTYQNCYYECKGGCKEFCRKVTVDGASEKQVTQITKTSHRVPNGQLHSEHVHQQIFVPLPTPYTPHVPYTPATSATPIAHLSATQEIYPPPSTNELSNSYGHTQLAYKIQAPQPILPTTYAKASPAPSIYDNSKSDNNYSEALLDASYSVDDLTRLLQMENLNRNSATAYYQPAVYGPSYASNAEVPLYTIQPASPYHLPLPEPKYSSSAPTYAEANKSYPVVPPQYKNPAESNPATPSPSTATSSATQYTNYINKGYSSGPTQYGSAAEPNKDQQSAHSLTHQAVYSDPSVEYENSIPYNSLASAYAPRPQLYGM